MPKFLGEIIQNGGDFALLDSSNIRGGFMQVATIEERDRIIPDKLKKGMHVYVDENEKIYEWKGDQWLLFKVDSTSTGGMGLGFLSLQQRVERVTEVESVTGDTVLEVELTGRIQFDGNDIIGWDIDESLNGTYSKIRYIADGKLYIEPNDNPPVRYSTIYLCGNTSDRSRSLVLAIHNLNGAVVLSQFQNISLDGINTNYYFRFGKATNDTWSTYGENVYLKGTFIDEQGRNLGELTTINNELISTGIASVRRELGYDNLLENPYFINGMNCWLSENTAVLFRAGGKWIMTDKTLFSSKKDGAYVIQENGQSVLKLINGMILQRNHNLKKINNFDEVPNPSWVTLMFNYKVITPGNLTIKMGNTIVLPSTPLDIDTTDRYTTLKKSFKWDRTGDFRLEFSGELKVQTFVLKINELKNFEEKYKNVFEHADALVSIATQYEQSTT